MTRENVIVGGRITREMTRIISSIEALCLCGGGRSSVRATWIIYYYAKIVKNMLLPRPPSAQPPVTRSENKICCDRERKCVIARENHLKKRREEPKTNNKSIGARAKLKCIIKFIRNFPSSNCDVSGTFLMREDPILMESKLNYDDALTRSHRSQYRRSQLNFIYNSSLFH